MAIALEKGDHIIGMDIGGTKMMALVLDHEFKVVGRCKKKSKSSKKEEAAEARIARIIRQAMDEAGVKKVRGIGVGSPGPLDPKTGVIIDTPNLGWKDFPLAQKLEDEFSVPAAVDNDVNMGTYGEWHFGEVKDCPNVIGIFPGTGIGGGIIIDGKMLHGFSGAAGEIGHMTIQIDGPYCGCGKRGCLEALASRVAIASQIAAAAAREDAPYIREKCGTDLANIRSSAIADAIANGEKMVEGIVRRAAYHVGVGVANLVNILSPQAVVLGGGLVEAMESLYLEEVAKAVDEHAMPFLRKGIRIVPARLGDDAVALGAGKLISERLAAA